MAQVKTGNDKTDRMINMFIDELKYLDEDRSTMPGSQIYLNIKNYVNKIVDENIIHFAEDTQEEYDEPEDIVYSMRSQFDYDFNSGLARGYNFLSEEKLDILQIQWIERAYEYWVWECGFEANEHTIESKTDFIMYHIAKHRCIDWIERNELPGDEF